MEIRFDLYRADVIDISHIIMLKSNIVRTVCKQNFLHSFHPFFPSPFFSSYVLHSSTLAIQVFLLFAKKHRIGHSLEAKKYQNFLTFFQGFSIYGTLPFENQDFCFFVDCACRQRLSEAKVLANLSAFQQKYCISVNFYEH